MRIQSSTQVFGKVEIIGQTRDGVWAKITSLNLGEFNISESVREIELKPGDTVDFEYRFHVDYDSHSDILEITPHD